MRSGAKPHVRSTYHTVCRRYITSPYGDISLAPSARRPYGARRLAHTSGMKPLLLAACAAFLCVACPLSCPTALAQEGRVTLVLEGQTYSTEAQPLPLPPGQENYRAYFEWLWAYDHDLVHCLNTLSPALGDGVAALLSTLETPAKDAQVQIGTSGVTILPDQDGLGYDRYRLGLSVADCLDGKPTTPLSIGPVKAPVTAQDLRHVTQPIGQYTTYYDAANTARSHNIALAAKAISGTVIESGASWSFNEKVGERTQNRGYQPAPVIQDGAYTSGVGGGVCQVSTTLYNAALLAGLTVASSHPHSLRAHYVPLGLDAMVSSWSDLVLVNPTPHPIYLFATATGGRLSVKVLGESPGEVKVWSGKPSYTPAPNVDQEGNSLLDTTGYTLVHAGEDGAKVTTYRTIGGVKERLRTSAYQPVPNVWTKDNN